jgi:hypothetical protein
MAYTKSGLYLNTFMAQILATAETGTGGLNPTVNTFKMSLLVYATATDGASPVNFSAATAPWVNTFESTGTAWVTGGYTLATLATGAADVVATLAEGTTGSVRYNFTNPVSKVSTSIAGFGGFIVYADAVSLPVVKPMFLSVCFGAAYTTVVGTLGITPSATGFFELDVTP